MNTIIFDVDDTLYDQAQSFHKTFKKLFDFPHTYEQIDQVYRTSRKYSEILFDKSEAGELTKEEWQIGRITAACKDFDIPIDEQKARVFHETYVAEQQRITLFSEVEQLLDVLVQEGKELAILTNGDEEHQAMKIKQLGLTRWFPEENIFISGAHGHAKPKREIFEIMESKMGLDKSKTVYIGDSFEKDVVGAKQVGWKAVWMNHRKRIIPEGATFKADKEVHNAKELLYLFV
ncbi:HAD family hydrolase [Aquibacillus koreensis]|uniref:HAD family hydrolase n=1 Tax=Aquibacillus koreensis TaxID=279446 RepID=A0A9X3WPH9_9BACI|nr:HAD family hydrolase [Aquibacillus koreensis]MCT2535205.1 HAD family hydrolase [Aquibacillus koreensis]MDC3421064.1 HAD family hydrolase [Aquibacillus koreensis]